MNGVLNVLKPPAMTSSDVVTRLRRMLGVRKTGHTGTLDPGAAGVLPVCVGRATKVADYIMAAEKEYIAEICFGAETDTQDSYGVIINRADTFVSQDDLQRVIPRFLGTVMQRPPMYSAIKHEGRKLYQLARKGIEVEKPPREVCIHAIDILHAEKNRFLLKVQCSKGTYIRSLCADMGRALGAYAYTSFLMRTKTGGYRIEDAWTLDELEALCKTQEIGRAMIPLETALDFMPRICCGGYLYDILTTGTPVDLNKAPNLQVESGVTYAVYCRNELIGIGKRAADMLKIVSMLKLREG